MRAILTFDNKGYVKAHSNGRNGHTHKTSIMELIQNADDANSNKILIKYRGKSNMLVIADNGIGMPIEKLESMSVLYRHEDSEKTKHGKFGIGAKEAFLTLGGKWTVLSKQVGSTDISKLEWDSDKLVKWSNGEIEYGKYVSTSDNASEVLRRFYQKTMKTIAGVNKPKEISGTVVIGEMGSIIESDKDEFTKELVSIIRDISLKHQKIDTKIYYDIDTFKGYNGLVELEAVDWLNFKSVETNKKVTVKIGVIERKNRRKYYNYFIEYNGKYYRFSKNNFTGFVEDERMGTVKCSTIDFSITMLEEQMVCDQENILRTNRKKLSGVLVNRNGHFLYTDSLEWKMKNIPVNLRCELKYNNSDIDDIFRVKMNKSHFIFSQVDSTLKKMVEYILNKLLKYIIKYQDVEKSFQEVLETYANNRNRKEEEVEKEMVPEKTLEEEKPVIEKETYMEENEHLKKEIEKLREKLSKFKEDEVDEVEVEEIEPKESKFTNKEIVDRLVTRGGEHNLGDAEIEIKCFTELLSTVSDNNLELDMPHSKKLFAHMNECLRKLVKQGLIERRDLLIQFSSPE